MSRAKSTLEQWRILQAVVDCGGYAQAAEKLSKSQSSLNHAVAKLQHQLGIELLEVRGRKAFLTSQGEVLLRRSRHVTQAVNELEQLASNLEQGWEPTLTLAREIVYPMEELVAVLKAFMPESRGTRITILDSVLTGTQELIQHKKVDMAITGGMMVPGHLAQPLCSVELVLVCHPQHPLAALGNIEDEKLLAQHLQLVIKDTGVHSTLDVGWLKAEQRWTVSNFHEAISILQSGIGFCWIPHFLVKDKIARGELTRLTLQGSFYRKVLLSLVIPNRDTQGPAAKHLESLFLKQHGIDREPGH
jgi:DNA-binding transcriptional LysR family regulator